MHVKLRPRTRLLERVCIFSKKQPFCSVVPNNLTFGLFEMSLVEICFTDGKCDIEIDHLSIYVLCFVQLKMYLVHGL